MPIARIVTRFPERAAALRKTLLDSGYHVDVVRPEDAARAVADIEYDLDDMPEYAGKSDAPVEREFIFAPQWRALKARFGKADEPAIEQHKPVQPSVSYARLEEKLDEKFVDQPAKGPSLLERIQAMRAPLAEKLNSARQDLDQKCQQLAQHMAERRAAAEEARRVREAELATKHEADRVAAERARAEAAVRLQEQEARDAQRRAEVAAQMEIRRQEQERQLAEELTHDVARESASEPVAPVAGAPAGAPIDRRRGLGEIIGSAFQNLGDWSRTHASAHFANTRSYAFRQYAPAVAGIALAFFLGWAIAVGGARKTAASDPPVKAEQATPATVPAAVPAVVAPVAPKAAPAQTATAAKPKAQVRRFRSPSKDDEVVWKDGDDGGSDVTVIHHYPGKSNLARSGKKNGVKTISDLEQD